MRLLIAIKSCVRDAARGDHDAIRRTWGKDFPARVDLRFFMGRDVNYLGMMDDEVMVDAPDDYDSLPYKSREILRWSIQQNYDFSFLADTDTFVVPSKLMSCGFEKYDIAARFGTIHPVGGLMFEYTDGRGKQGPVHPWPSGGLGYFVSRKAAEIIVVTEPLFWAEDMSIGGALGPHLQSGELKGLDIPDYECNISWHWPRRATGRPYEPASGWMERMQDLYGSTK